jgi:GxxExxY protein
VKYDNQVVGEFKADILVEGVIILELKSIKQITQAHEVQLVTYLAATGKPVGLILNFGEEKVKVRRKIKDLKSD